jgi:hypothetical protein
VITDLLVGGDGRDRSLGEVISSSSPTDGSFLDEESW